MRVRRILLKYYRPRGFAGSEATKAELLEELRRRTRAYAMAYAATTAGVLMVYGLCWGYFSNRLGLTIALGAVSMVWIELTRRIAESWAQCRLLLVILPDYREDQLHDLVGRIVEQRSDGLY